MGKKIFKLFVIMLVVILPSCSIFKISKKDYYKELLGNVDDLNTIYDFVYNTNLIENFKNELIWIEIEQLPDNIQKICKNLNISNIRINGESSKKIEDHLMGNSIILMSEYTPFIGGQKMAIKYYSYPIPIRPVERDKYIVRRISDDIFYVEIW